LAGFSRASHPDFLQSIADLRIALVALGGAALGEPLDIEHHVAGNNSLRQK
jgi:hypothetical protein